MEKLSRLTTPIKYWAREERPRERMVAQGAASLTNAELLAILINNGTKQKSAIDLAREILLLADNNLAELGKLSLKEIQKIRGIGQAKAIAVAAALEMGRRREATSPLYKTTVRRTSDITSYLKSRLKDYPFEVFAVLFLNRANKVNHFEVISIGGITGTIADPRVILKKAVEEDATSLILCHNHPSGNLKPSMADKEITFKIKQAASYLDIQVADHIIVSETGFFSFADDGLL